MQDKWIPITVINQSKAEKNIRFLSVTQEIVGKLKMIRPGVYLDDPRLTLVKDLPEHKKPPQTKAEPKISPEMQAWIDGAYARYLAEQAVKATPAAMPRPEPKPMSGEEKLQYDWKHSPSLRKEFVSFGSYQAYMRAAESGRCRVYRR